MADDEDMEIDPAIAEAMGFSGFGGTKRKFKDDAFVDPSASNKSANGANNVPLGTRAPQTDRKHHDERQQNKAGHQVLQQVSLENATLEDLRQGVKDERGDTVYFQPSFIEDPWKDLTPR